MSFKLSKKSIDIIQNLASIEPSMILVEGNEQASSSMTAKVYATAKLPDSIDATFGMYNIMDLLSHFKIFGDDEFELSFNKNNNIIKVYNDIISVDVHTSDRNMIAEPRIGQSIGEDPHDIVFNIPNDMLYKMNEIIKVVGTDVIAFVKRDDDTHLRIEGYDYNNLKECSLKGYPERPIWHIRLKEYEGESFKYFARMNFKIFDGDYEVRIRQFLGRRDDKSNQLNRTRPPAIQFDGEFIRYAITYIDMSENQKSLQEV